MQAYDAALLIDSAVKAVKGDLSNKDAIATALKKADFTSLRGPFKFNSNAIRSRTSISPRSRNGRTANSRPRSSKRCFRITVTATPRLRRQVRKRVTQSGGSTIMKDEIAGITRANEGIQGIS